MALDVLARSSPVAAALLIPDARFLFFINLVTVVGVVAFSTGVIVVLLRHSYQQRLEEQKLAAVGIATARILHQIKNPLQTILLHAELLHEGTAPDAAHRELSHAVLSESERLATMLNELSQWAAGARRSFALTPLPLHEVVHRVARMARHLASDGVQVEVEAADAVVLADVYFLQQALDNLIRNAVEAMDGQPDARLTLGVRCAKGEAVLFVADNGPGIPPERLREIFEPFISTKGTGMGLGLAIAQEIVEGHSGRIDVDSTPGTGTTFRIALPLSTVPLPEPDALAGFL